MRFPKSILVYTAFITVLMISFLFAPKPQEYQGPQQYCPVKYIQLNKSMGFVMNCDAIEFLGSSVNPQLLFESNYSRQSRPLYILTGSALGYAIYYLVWPLHDFLERNFKDLFQYQIPPDKVSLYVSHYSGLILLNLILLILALYLFEKLVHQFSGGRKNGIWLRMSFAILFLSSYVTKTFFWVPHQQLFSLILPMAAVLFYANIANDSRNLKKMAGYSMAAGILLLFYGSFLLLLPTMLIAILMGSLREARAKAGFCLKASGITIVCFSLPVAIWYVILKINGIVFFSKEIAYFREFVWIKDAILKKNSNFIQLVSEQAMSYISTFGILIFPLMILLYSKMMCRYNQIKNRENKVSISVPGHAVFPLTAALILLFCFSIGYYSDRITYTCAPLFICYASVLLEKQKLSSIQILSFMVISICWHGFLMFFEMPHFSSRFYY